jgi:thiol-disulfide isomerase/thioredoxin
MKRNWYFVIAIVLVCGFIVLGFKHTPKPADRAALLGKPAPDFKLDNFEGGQTSLSDFKGKVVYLDIWATWCGPCIEQMKYGEKLKEAFIDNKDVVFLYVSIDSDENKWKKYLKSNHVHGVHLISREGDEEQLRDRYALDLIPRFVLIDKSGNVAQFHAKAPSDAGTVEDIKALLK